jgi:DnaJ-domain-containing protein 1
MTERTALKAALSVLHLPASVRRVRSEPLPPGIEAVLKIAAGDEEAEAEAARLTERPRAVVREAAIFYIEQVLLCPGADSYRVLGATPSASAQELRRHMALLLSWLHPDKTPSRAAFAARVTGAWNDLRSPDRRAAYDAALNISQSNGRGPSQHLSRTPSAMKTKGRHLSLTSHHHAGRDSGLIGSEHQSLLRRGWRYLRRRLRDRSTP